ncbi:cytochrome P450 307a1-like [Culicoides brevitarsis]|uniref:cytochrome P450 307a1-like n=1 Tax=Culicoides brevitarsis TaxID=469753 RepID=UPI00307BE389
MYPSLILLASSNTIYVLCVCIALAIIMLLTEINTKKVRKLMDSITTESLVTMKTEIATKNKAPGPKPLPIIGNLAVLDGYEVPYQAFTDLAQKYGNIVTLKLGTVPALVVNGLENIKEVLIHKGQYFDGRPNFRRYHQLFCGNKENSLAFCDWSDMQKMRREMLVPHTFPRNFSMRHSQLNEIVTDHMSTMMSEFSTKETLDIKPIILQTCANIFMKYFTNKSFDAEDAHFQKLISNFDKIFFEVNQGYAADFLPFLQPLHRNNMKRMAQWSEEIREVILKCIVEDRFENWNQGDEAQDYLESLIDYVKSDSLPKLEWDTALFALEDIVGGHAAVGNFLIKVFGYVAVRPDIQAKIQQEIEETLTKFERPSNAVEINDRNRMPYTEAVIMEALRMISSPIVPHVSNQDTTIAGYDVPKDTLIFLNNYDLNMNPKLWTNPESFEPQRFINANGGISKPDHFMPFGSGRRSCMGYKICQMLAFTLLANTINNFDIVPLENENYKVQCGSLAMPEETYRLRFVPRH